MEKKILTVSIGICAYNAEKNIGNILTALLNQKTVGFELVEIIVHSDMCKDETNAIVKSFTDSRVSLIASTERKGFVGSLLKIFNTFTTDILVTFNDDVKIEDDSLIKKLINPFIIDSEVGMVGGNTRPLPSKSFIESAIESTFNAYEKNELTINNGNNIHGVDGKIMVFPRKVLELFQYPTDLKKMGNVDGYLYFETLRNGYKYIQVRDAIVYFRNPSTIKDYVNWTARNNASITVLEQRFGKDVVEKEYTMNRIQMLKFVFIECIKNPLGCIFIFFMRFYIKIKSKSISKNFDNTWEVIETSKMINLK